MRWCFWMKAGAARRWRHFIPAYCPHLNPIERLWGLAHKNITHNKTYDKCGQSAGAMLDFLRSKVPENRAAFRDTVTGNFRVIPPKDFRVMA